MLLRNGGSREHHPFRNSDHAKLKVSWKARCMLPFGEMQPLYYGS